MCIHLFAPAVDPKVVALAGIYGKHTSQSVWTFINAFQMQFVF